MQTSILPEHRIVVVVAAVVGVVALRAVVGSDDTEHCQWTRAKAVSVRRGHGDDPGQSPTKAGNTAMQESWV